MGPLFGKRRHRDTNGSAKDDLASRLVTQTRRKVDPFLQKASSFGQASKEDALADIVVVKQSNAKEGSCQSGSPPLQLINHYARALNRNLFLLYFYGLMGLVPESSSSAISLVSVDYTDSDNSD